jgi:hypothetical protein
MILKAKTLKNGPGRPSFTYALPPNIKQRVDLVVTEPYTTIVSLAFQKLKHLCRFEKGGYYKNTRRRCEARKCNVPRIYDVNPQSREKSYIESQAQL